MTMLFFIILLGVAFIVLATSRFKLHPFLSLIIASFGVGIFAGVPLPDVVAAVNLGFGNILGYIGIVIVAGTIIGKILEKSGAAIKMAEVLLRIVGEKHPQLGMSLIGALVSIPVFCDSAFVILASMKKALAKRTKVSPASMSIALATGLYATHTLVPPTPGPIAAAGNLGASSYLGIIILMGLIVAVPTILVGYLWAVKVAATVPAEGIMEAGPEDPLEAKFQGKLPSTIKAFTPILLPIFLIGLGSILAVTPLRGTVIDIFQFVGSPVVALLIGVMAAFFLLPAWNEKTMTGWIGEALQDAALILLLTGAGGAFGAVISATPVTSMVKGLLVGEEAPGAIILLIPFLIATALKTAQGSSTAAIVVTSALIGPTLAETGITSPAQLSLMVMAIGAGAMTVSHVNDSYFWVVTQFSGIKIKDAYKAHTMASLVQGVTALATSVLLWLILV